MASGFIAGGLALVGSVISSRAAKKEGNANRAAAADNSREATRLLEEEIVRNEEFAKRERERSDSRIEQIRADTAKNQADLDKAKSIGDAAAVKILEEKLTALQETYDNETEIAIGIEREITAKKEATRSRAIEAFAGDLEAQDAIKKGNLDSLGDTLKMVQESDKRLSDAVPRSMDDIENSLTQARTKQDEAFRSSINEAERGAAKRGEDPRRATLNLKIAQAKARGKLTADTMRGRAMDRMDVARSGPNGSAATNIINSRNGLAPTAKSRLAEVELGFLDEDVSRSDVVNAKSEQRRLALDSGKSDAIVRDIAGGADRNVGNINDQMSNRSLESNRVEREQDRISEVEAQALKATNKTSNDRAAAFDSAAASNISAANDASARSSRAISEGVGAVAKIGADAYKNKKKKKP